MRSTKVNVLSPNQGWIGRAILKDSSPERCVADRIFWSFQTRNRMHAPCFSCRSTQSGQAKYKKIMKLIQTHMNNLGLVDTFMSEINCSSNAQCSTNEVLKMYLCTHTVQHSVQEELCQCLWWKYPFTWICWKDWSYLIWEAPVLKWKRWKRWKRWRELWVGFLWTYTVILLYIHINQRLLISKNVVPSINRNSTICLL